MRKSSLLLAMVSVFTIAIVSCKTAGLTTTSKIGEVPTIMTEVDMKNTLGDGYFQDSIVKKLHVINSSDVTWKSENQQTKVSIDFLDDKVVSMKNKTESMMSGTLPAGTVGQVDSVVRYNTKNIWKLKVKYTIKQTGRDMYIWYYRKDDELDVNLHWFQSNNNQPQAIEGVSLMRTTFDNKLQWMFEVGSKKTTKSTGFDVVSPFGGTKSGEGNGNPAKPKKEEEQEEKN